MTPHNMKIANGTCMWENSILSESNRTRQSQTATATTAKTVTGDTTGSSAGTVRRPNGRDRSNRMSAPTLYLRIIQNVIQNPTAIAGRPITATAAGETQSGRSG